MPLFSDRLTAAQRKTGNALCVGLDPDLDRIPEHIRASRSPAAAVEYFCRSIIDATAAYAAVYKFNFAFFESLGDPGVAVLRRVRRAVPRGALTIADAKRGDIGNSARFYAHSAFDDLGFDSITVSPYMGEDSVLPFLQRPHWMAFVLVRTSNPGRADIQDLPVGGHALFQHVARRCVSWTGKAAGEIGFVAGASDLESMRSLRQLAPEAVFLIPGIGAQGGDPSGVMQASGSAPGQSIVNSSRSICYASAGEDFAAAAEQAAAKAAHTLAVHGLQVDD
jgi:orotidine-5'-phosphate decarboxylase